MWPKGVRYPKPQSGLPAIKALNVLQQVDAQVDAVEVPILEPNCSLALARSAKSTPSNRKSNAMCNFIQHRKFRQEPVKRELQDMELSNQSQIQHNSAGKVVVPKETHICVNLKPLNESIMWEVYPLPNVDTTLAMLSRAKVFSKLDQNGKFHRRSPNNYQISHFLGETRFQQISV